MTMRNLLLPVFEGIEFDTQLSVAFDIARAFRSHIGAVFLRPDPQSTFASLPAVIAAAGVTAAEIEREGRKAEKSAHSHFETWRKERQIAEERNELVEAVVATWSERIGPLEGAITRLGRLSDLMLVSRPDSYESRTERAFDAAVFETGDAGASKICARGHPRSSPGRLERKPRGRAGSRRRHAAAARGEAGLRLLSP